TDSLWASSSRRRLSAAPAVPSAILLRARATISPRSSATRRRKIGSVQRRAAVLSPSPASSAAARRFARRPMPAPESHQRFVCHGVPRSALLRSGEAYKLDSYKLSLPRCAAARPFALSLIHATRSPSRQLLRGPRKAARPAGQDYSLLRLFERWR